MPTEPPIACTLGATEMPVRLDQMAGIGRDALVASRVDGAWGELRFSARPGVRDRIVSLVAAEARCCPFLEFGVADEPGWVVLTIAAPPGGEPVVAGLVDAFGSRTGAA